MSIMAEPNTPDVALEPGAWVKRAEFVDVPLPAVADDPSPCK